MGNFRDISLYSGGGAFNFSKLQFDTYYDQFICPRLSPFRVHPLQRIVKAMMTQSSFNLTRLQRTPTHLKRSYSEHSLSPEAELLQSEFEGKIRWDTLYFCTVCHRPIFTQGHNRARCVAYLHWSHRYDASPPESWHGWRHGNRRDSDSEQGGYDDYCSDSEGCFGYDEWCPESTF